MLERSLTRTPRWLLLAVLCCLAWLSVSHASLGAPRTTNSGAEISGVARDERNRAVANAVVEIYAGPQLQSTFTDKRGRYELTNLPPGSYQLRAYKGGYITQYSGDVFVLPGDQLTQDFRLVWSNSAMGGIEASILTTKGQPLADASVQLSQDGVSLATGITDENGSVVFSNLPAGVYRIEAARAGFQPSSLRSLRVRSGRLSSAALRLKPSREDLGYLSGTVRNEAGHPVERAVVKIVQGLSSGTQRTSVTGEFAFTDVLPAAGYVLQVSASGYATQLVSDLLVSPRANTAVEVILLENSPKLGSLAGRVFDADGIPLPGAEVSLSSGPSAGEHTTTDDEGKFAFQNLAPGSNYAVVVTCPGYKPAGSALLEVRKGFTTSVDFYLEPRQGASGSLAGIVKDHLGRAISGVSVSILMGPSAGLTITTDSAGSYRFPDLEPSTDYRLSLTHPQYEGVIVSQIEVRSGEETVRDVEMLPIGLRFGEVFGVVRTRSQGPIEDANISLLSGPSAPLQTSSNERGEFVFRNLRPGTYGVRIEKEGYVTVTKADILVQENQVAYVDAVMDQAAQVGKISGRVISLSGAGIANAFVTVLSGPAAGASTRTDSSGRFTLNQLPPGTYTLEASANGYRSAQKGNIAVGAQSTTNVTIQLLNQ